MSASRILEAQRQRRVADTLARHIYRRRHDVADPFACADAIVTELSPSRILVLAAHIDAGGAFLTHAAVARMTGLTVAAVKEQWKSLQRMTLTLRDGSQVPLFNRAVDLRFSAHGTSLHFAHMDPMPYEDERAITETTRASTIRHTSNYAASLGRQQVHGAAPVDAATIAREETAALQEQIAKDAAPGTQLRLVSGA